jgi:carboxymethylenebutenolidase
LAATFQNPEEPRVTNRRTAADFPQDVLDIFDGYIHGDIDRRAFLDRAARYAVGGFTAAAMLEALTPNYALAQQVAKDDPRIRTEYLTYPSVSDQGSVRGYFAMPAHPQGKLPGVLVYSENRGLNPYIEDVARRLAAEGFLAFAPDALSPMGGYPGDEEKAAQLFATLDPKKRSDDLIAAYAFLASRPECNGAIGAVGFCFGGGIVNMLAVREPKLAAAVPFYGVQPSAADTASIKAPLLIHYAGLDTRIDSGWPAWKAALDANHIRYQQYTYPDVNHGFHNDTTPRYDEAAAKLAWSRTIAFFNQHLRGGKTAAHAADETTASA